MTYAIILYATPFRPHCTDNLSMPADIIKEGKLSALQLEAIVYGCQRHQQHLPAADPKRTFVAPSNNDKKKKKSKTALKDNTTANQTFPAIKAEKKKGAAGAATSDAPTPNDVPPKPTVGYRKGFLVGDGAGMGKGRTLAGFVLENNAVGRKRHIWVSVSSDLYDDAKRDLTDLGLDEYAQKQCYLLRDEKYGKLKIGEGVLFTTYNTLIAKGKGGGKYQSRLEQIIDWCGGDSFDGLIMLDECHKAKNIKLDENGKPMLDAKNKAQCSKSAAAVVELQTRLPQARIVYCSATSVTEPKNMGFMDRLGLWGPGTEHPQGFNQFLKSVEHLGCGAMELHAMHLKGEGALVARTLSYEDCNFEAVPNVMNGNIQAVYDQSASLWKNLNAFLADSLETNFGDDSDDEDEDLDDAALAQQEERRKHRDQLSCKPGVVKSRFWGAHQRFFRSLCIAAKVDKAIEIAQQAIDEGSK